MPKDVNCPYCGAEQDICHDDGYGYEEDRMFDQTCHECDRTFIFTTSIRFLYEVSKADCLNGDEHKYKPTHTYPVEYTKMRCAVCDRARACTTEEMEQVLRSRGK